MKSIKTLACALLIAVSINTAKAGVGFGQGAVQNIMNRGNIILTTAGVGAGVFSVWAGVNLVRYGVWGWGSFLILLNEHDVISVDEMEALEGLEVSQKEALLEIMASDMTREEKDAEIAELF